jgi:hypothetical protein
VTDPAVPTALPDNVVPNTPAPVRQAAANLLSPRYARFRLPPERKAVIERMLTDPRMENVWSALGRKNRADRQYVNSDTPPDLAGLEEVVHGQGELALFLTAAGLPVLLGYWPADGAGPPMITKPQLAEMKRELKERAEQLRKISVELGINFDAQIEGCEIEARSLDRDYSIVFDRQSKDLPLRAAAQTLLQTMHEHFGAWNYGLVATILSVVFGRPVPYKLVRGCAKSVPVTMPCP